MDPAEALPLRQRSEFTSAWFHWLTFFWRVLFEHLFDRFLDLFFIAFLGASEADTKSQGEHLGFQRVASVTHSEVSVPQARIIALRRWAKHDC